MFNLGAPELILIVILAILVFGPDKLPEIAGQLGRSIRDFRRMSNEMTDGLAGDVKGVVEVFEQTSKELTDSVKEIQGAVTTEVNALNQSIAGATAEVQSSLKPAAAAPDAPAQYLFPSEFPPATGSAAQPAAADATAAAIAAVPVSAAIEAATAKKRRSTRPRKAAAGSNMAPAAPASWAPDVAMLLPDDAAVSAPPLAAPIVAGALEASPAAKPRARKPRVGAAAKGSVPSAGEAGTAPAARAPRRRKAAAAPADDLSLIEGIGPKIDSLLKAAGIATFAQLAQTDSAHLRSVLKANKLAFIDPDTWAEQAQLAAGGKMDDLKALQHTLKGGRRV